MSEFLLIILAAIAVATTIAVASKISAFDFSPFARGIIGAVAAVVVEIVRIFIAMQITEMFVKGRPSDTTEWLANLRVFNIPILVGIGFLVAHGSAQPAAQTSPETPKENPSKSK